MRESPFLFDRVKKLASMAAHLPPGIRKLQIATVAIAEALVFGKKAGLVKSNAERPALVSN